MIDRRKTRVVQIGGIKIGGAAPIVIQSMTKVETSNVKAVVAQIRELERLGCEIIRVAVKSESDSLAVKQIKKKIHIPLVADIHFDYRLALKAIASGADKIRLNPGNIKKRDEVMQVVRAAKKAKIPIRVGVNSGSTAGEYVKSAMDYIKILEESGFRDIIISLKASGVKETIDAYREMSARCDYPLHLGVTASGPYESGIIKSSIGIGALLLDGIGDTIRVSLTDDPAEEVVAAKRILGSLNLRRSGPEIISCPTCGRCQVDLVSMVQKLEDVLKGSANKSGTIAVMGCEVNGPGEAKVADVGIAFGKGSGMLFKKGKIVKKVATKDAMKELLKLYEMD